MLAALPMYFAPRQALDAFWADVAARLLARGVREVPANLAWPSDYHAHWLEPDLLLSQTCGYPLTHALQGRVALVGAFAYDVPGASGIQCRSQLICRASDTRRALGAFVGGTVAFNSTDSQSGYNALRHRVAQSGGPRPFFRHSIETGGHGKSIESVRYGLADLASIDCVTWALWQEVQPTLAAELVVFDHTDPYPGLPLVTSLATPAATLQALQECLGQAIADPAMADVVRALHISGFKTTTADDYTRCLAMEDEARALGVTAL